MLSRIRINAKYIWSKFWITAAAIFGFMTIVQMFVDWKTIGIEDNDTKYKLIIFAVIILLCFIIALGWGLLSSKKVTVFSKDDVKVIVQYDDLMRIAFPKKKQSERIVVIAVNCCYDTIVNDTIISERSVHGQFLKRFASTEKELRSLDNEIEKSLKKCGYDMKELGADEKREGKRRRYPMGSVACIKGKNGVTFFLLALTEFDVDCVAHCEKDQYFDSLLKLFQYYDKHGQGKELYLYPMGTGMARTGISKKEALDCIVLMTKISQNLLKTKTTIIVDRRNKNELSITDL